MGELGSPQQGGPTAPRETLYPSPVAGWYERQPFTTRNATSTAYKFPFAVSYTPSNAYSPPPPMYPQQVWAQPETKVETPAMNTGIAPYVLQSAPAAPPPVTPAPSPPLPAAAAAARPQQAEPEPEAAHEPAPKQKKASAERKRRASQGLLMWQSTYAPFASLFR